MTDAIPRRPPADVLRDVLAWQRACRSCERCFAIGPVHEPATHEGRETCVECAEELEMGEEW